MRRYTSKPVFKTTSRNVFSASHSEGEARRISKDVRHSEVRSTEESQKRLVIQRAKPEESQKENRSFALAQDDGIPNKTTKSLPKAA